MAPAARGEVPAVTLALPMRIPRVMPNLLRQQTHGRIITEGTRTVLEWIRIGRELRPEATRKERRERVQDRYAEHRRAWHTLENWDADMVPLEHAISSACRDEALRYASLWPWVRTTAGTIRICERHRRTADSLPGDVQCADDSDAGRALALACALERMGR